MQQLAKDFFVLAMVEPAASVAVLDSGASLTVHTPESQSQSVTASSFESLNQLNLGLSQFGSIFPLKFNAGLRCVIVNCHCVHFICS